MFIPAESESRRIGAIKANAAAGTKQYLEDLATEGSDYEYRDFDISKILFRLKPQSKRRFSNKRQNNLKM